MPILKLAATEIVSGISGESESRLRDLFDQAMAAAPCLLFIDEIDAITQRRDQSNKGNNGKIFFSLPRNFLFMAKKCPYPVFSSILIEYLYVCRHGKSHCGSVVGLHG